MTRTIGYGENRQSRRKKFATRLARLGGRIAKAKQIKITRCGLSNRLIISIAPFRRTTPT
ncbi:hypothetical protein RlegWSM1455_29765 (plasmid) [Rhizobium laguerreae]|uniref:hypothetical protein n=1 Tax=Rhizobium laguerreae TaxID=1076926 RepID=UPI001E3A5292|nr:hypothetical protein [Rhizobium laguerreae]UFW68263.1 hypothetical protein RlegWSM1455_29765 [Rhizobium laguerreae]